MPREIVTYSSGTPPWPAAAMLKTVPAGVLMPGPPTPIPYLIRGADALSARNSPSDAWSKRRKVTKRIAWGSFLAAIGLVSTAVAALFFGVLCLAALAGSASIAAYGLLYTAGMDLAELDKRTHWRVVN